MNLGATELIIILLIILLLFGATRLPRLARSFGEVSREFKKGTGETDPAPPVERPPGPTKGSP